MFVFPAMYTKSLRYGATEQKSDDINQIKSEIAEIKKILKEVE